MREDRKERERGKCDRDDYEVRRRARIARHARQEEERRGEGQRMRRSSASLHHFPPLARPGNGRRGAPAPRTWA